VEEVVGVAAPVARDLRDDERERVRAIMRTDSVDDPTMRFVVVADGVDYTAGAWKPTSSSDGAIFAIVPETRLRVDLVYAVTLAMVRAMMGAGLAFVVFEVFDRSFVAAVSKDMDAGAYFVPGGVDADSGAVTRWTLRMDLRDAESRLVRWFSAKWVAVA